MIKLAGHDFSEHSPVVVCECVVNGRPVGIFQNAPDSLSMVCGNKNHDAAELMNMCLHHLVGRSELSNLPIVDCGFGAFRDYDDDWNIFKDDDDA